MDKTRHLLRPLMTIVMLLAWLVPTEVWAATTYNISSAADLKAFANKVNGGETDAIGKLTADITLSGSWTPIGTSSKPYTGTFDGQKYKVSGISITATGDNCGFFGYTNGATIQNVTLAGTLSSAYNNTGSVVGSAKGNTKLYNVYSGINVNMTAAKNHVGGLVGQILLLSGGYTTQIKGCTYSGTMALGSCSDSNGGILGYAEKNANVQIEYCWFSGSITTSASSPNALGGILGYADDDGDAQNFQYIRNCFCSGTISPSSGTYVGAIAGQPKGKVPNGIENNNYLSGVAAKALGNGKTSATSTAITVSVNAGTGGKVSQSYVNPTSTTPTQLKVEATTAEHYHFGSWSDNGAQTHNVGLTDNVNLTASFAIDRVHILVTSLYGAPGSTQGTGTYDYGSKITIKAIPDEHAHFVKWGDGDTHATRTITVTEECTTYHAYFAIDQHTITVKANNDEAGTVSGSGTFNYGTKATITAKPNKNYQFVQWDDGDTHATRTIDVMGDKTYTAIFAGEPRTITLSVADYWKNQGTVSGAGTYDYGSKQTITATPNTGYHFVSWTDGDTHASRTITVTASKGYTAIFEAHTYDEIIDTPATCTTTGIKHAVCTHKGCTARIDDIVIPALKHDFSSFTTTADYLAQPATCTRNAKYYYKCSRCDAKNGLVYYSTEEKDKAIGHGHENGYEVSYYWVHNDDGYYCEYKLVCHSCNERVSREETLPPTKLEEGYVAPTCTEKGVEVWQAEAIYENDNDAAFHGTDKHTFEISAKGHASNTFDENGFGHCDECHVPIYQPADLVDSWFEIGNVGQLYWFAEGYNSGYNYSNAKLIADIVVNDGTFDADGNFTARGASTTSTPRSWTPIGNSDRKYYRVFDGQGHTISGLYFNEPNTSGVGFIGYGVHSCVENISIINCYFNGYGSVGAICGVIDGGRILNSYASGFINGVNAVGGINGLNTASSEINNCWSDCSVTGIGNYIGGITGQTSTGSTAKNCYSMGSVSGGTCVGGICGRNISRNNNICNVENCYTTATVSGTTNVGSICGCNTNDSFIKNCYSTNTSSLPAIGLNEGTFYLCETGVAADRFASGEMACQLNGSVDDEGNWTPGATDGTQAWYQQLGSDAAPVLTKDGDKNTVYVVDNSALDADSNGTIECADVKQIVNSALSAEPAHNVSSVAKAVSKLGKKRKEYSNKVEN
ncbi:MAG: hypothetical protein MJZ60_01890 [Bacteroidaceae bacterium]|nr:hypothetical protein [Bacteroidaceae bacterium]